MKIDRNIKFVAELNIQHCIESLISLFRSGWLIESGLVAEIDIVSAKPVGYE